MTSPDLFVEGVSRTHADGTRAVDEAQLRLPVGQLTVLLGPSGCGKSTLLRQIAGLEPLDTGRILFGGEDISPLAPERRGFAMVFQEHALFTHLDVRGNVAFAPVEQRLGRSECAERVAEALARLHISALAERRVAQLSGGQQQRVAVARALAARPRLLLLDEPFSSLDQSLRLEMQQMLRDLLRGSGLTALLVTHDQLEAFALADHMALMHQGRIVQQGHPLTLYETPATPWAARFLGHHNLSEEAGDGHALLWRDEDLQLLPPQTPLAKTAGHRLPVRLTEALVLGPRIELHLNADGAAPTDWPARWPLQWRLRLSRREWLALDRPQAGQAFHLVVQPPCCPWMTPR